jgi:hypothetical protein
MGLQHTVVARQEEKGPWKRHWLEDWFFHPRGSPYWCRHIYTVNRSTGR